MPSQFPWLALGATHLTNTSQAAFLFCIAASYLLLVRWRRLANLRALERRFAHLVDDPAKMTYTEAFEISRLSTLWDMPTLMTKALEFALFQTYAIPSISALLCQSRRLTDPAQYPRRGEDTGCLIREFTTHGLDSRRGSLALSRMNWIHARYGSKISRDDALFTLSLFVYEPIEMTDRFGWRSLTKLERQARFVFWREVGARMGIKDLPRTSDELAVWRSAYEEERMVFSETNQRVAEATFDLMLRAYPARLKPMARELAVVVIPVRVREAFGWGPARPSWLHSAVPAAFGCCGFFVRHCMLPRSSPADFGLQDPRLESTNPSGERVYRRTGWNFVPYYCVKTASNVWWALLGADIPGAGYRPDGYVIERLGPEEWESKGAEAVASEAERMRDAAQGGRCPFAL